jgi:hypothetical protein
MPQGREQGPRPHRGRALHSDRDRKIGDISGRQPRICAAAGHSQLRGCGCRGGAVFLPVAGKGGGSCSGKPSAAALDGLGCATDKRSVIWSGQSLLLRPAAGAPIGRSSGALSKDRLRCAGARDRNGIGNGNRTRQSARRRCSMVLALGSRRDGACSGCFSPLVLLSPKLGRVGDTATRLPPRRRQSSGGLFRFRRCPQSPCRRWRAARREARPPAHGGSCPGSAGPWAAPP